MRRPAAFVMLLLLLHSLGAGVAVAQAPHGESHSRCSDAHGVMATESPDSGHHDAPGSSSGTSPAHCQAPWMTGCGASTGCGVLALRAPVPHAGTVPPATARRHQRDERTPDSPATELEAPPPRR